EYESALVKREAGIVQYESSAAFENVEGFLHAWMSMDRNTCPKRHLLSADRELIGTSAGADLNKNVAVVTKVDEMFAFTRTEHISLRHPCLREREAIE